MTQIIMTPCSDFYTFPRSKFSRARNPYLAVCILGRVLARVIPASSNDNQIKPRGRGTA